MIRIEDIYVLSLCLFQRLFTSFFIVIIIASSTTANAESIDLSKEYNEAIGKHLQLTQEENTQLGLNQAIKAFKNNQFTSSQHSIINLGLGSMPIWIAFDVINTENTVINRNLLLETSWIDKLDVYFVNDKDIINRYHTGDSLPFYERVVDHRFFVFTHNFKPGKTTVLIRSETLDPMVLPVYLLSPEATQKRRSIQDYSYGFLYGLIFALLAYNFMLFIGLKNNTYLYYAIYLLFFLLVNISYTGHGYDWLWSNFPSWQQRLNPILMFFYSTSGLLFASKFLNLKTAFPFIYRVVVNVCMLFGLLLTITMLSNNHLLSLLVAFTFMFIFTGTMVMLGIISLKAGNKSAIFFLLAAISAIVGAAITTASVWGIIPINPLMFRAVEIGMMLDAILLALALTNQFQTVEEEKNQAVLMARIDPLTNLPNRRAFYELVTPIWETGLRNKRDISLIALDIDNFKTFNDTYGHSHGDLILIEMGKLLKAEARAGDILVRWGGEEFLIFLPETKLADAVTIANRIRKKSLNTVVYANEEKTPFTVSLGVAHSADINQVTLDELIVTADKYLYSAKHHGRNCVSSIISS